MSVKRSSDEAPHGDLKRQNSARTLVAEGLGMMHLTRVPELRETTQEVPSNSPRKCESPQNSDADYEGRSFFPEIESTVIQKLQSVDGLSMGLDATDGFIHNVMKHVTNKARHHSHHQSDGHVEGFSIHLPPLCGRDQPHPFGIRLGKHSDGYCITHIDPHSSACEARLQKSDILTHLDQIDLRNSDETSILKQFMQVKETFSLTFLREVRNGDNTELVEITISVTIVIDVVNHEIEVELTVARFDVRYLTSSDPLLISQDALDKGQTYLNMDGRSMIMGTDEKVHFRLDFYTNPFRNGQMCVIRHCDSDYVLNPKSGDAQKMDKNNPERECLLIKETEDGGEHYSFESAEKRGTYLTSLGSSPGSTLGLRRFSANSLFITYP